MSHQLHADDTYVYLAITMHANVATLVKLLKLCLKDDQAWMAYSKPEHNQSKTESLLIGTKQCRINFSKCSGTTFFYLYFELRNSF